MKTNKTCTRRHLRSHGHATRRAGVVTTCRTRARDSPAPGHTVRPSPTLAGRGGGQVYRTTRGSRSARRKMQKAPVETGGFRPRTPERRRPPNGIVVVRVHTAATGVSRSRKRTCAPPVVVSSSTTYICLR
jgi:hypothetical protein